MVTYKTPDVYIEEISVFPPSVAEVETAIPAFIGYTEKALKNTANDLILKPTKIYSLKEYELYYGFPEDDVIAVTVTTDPTGGFNATVNEPTLQYLLYYALQMFFANGGGQCYIISVGPYQATPVIDLVGDATSSGLQDGLGVLALEDEPTLIVIPEAVKLSSAQYTTLVQAVLLQCVNLRDRFAIFDIRDGETNLDPTQLSTNRGYFGNNFLNYGAAYYPFLKTTINYFINAGETNVTVTPPPASGAVATATIATGAITTLTLTAPGTGYTSAPTVSITGGGGTGAAAITTILPGVVTTLNLTAPGTGYTSNPTVAITGGGGTGATATATAAGGVVTGLTITSGGTGYTNNPTVTITGGGGTGATATATVPGRAVANITLTSGGTGYLSAPTVTLTGGGGTGATANATAPIRAITGITVTSGGTGYLSAPTVTLTGGGGTGATATATVSGGTVVGVAITAGGTGYTTAPTVAFTGGSSSGNLASFKTSSTALYNFVKSTLQDRFVKLPPSGAVAGIYAATDSNRGVWKAPANASLANVIEPVIKLDNTRQDDLNVDATTGKSINAIRAFMGKGTLVWGARTLAGNDNEWRYIPVRRFFSVVEESIKKSTYWAVFEPNDANTWVKVRGMIENYLIQKWREGALAGATPKEAFFVKCGLGITMTSQDIFEGRMNVEIGIAVVRPAEFIILKFSHKLQTS